MAPIVRTKPIEPGISADINDVADYIIVRMDEASWLNVLKLQKLLYYVQAWSLAFDNRCFFNGRFQAWVHGPANREIYNRFKNTKSMYSRVRLPDVRDGFDPEALPKDVRKKLNSILEAYGDFSDDQLEEMTHAEPPWIEARKGCSPKDRCENEISETLMRDYYAAR